MAVEYLKEKLEEIRSILDNFVWIKEYQVFMQSLTNQYAKTYEKINETIQENNSIGLALRVLSTNNQLLEKSLAISELEQLNTLTEPKSTMSSREDFELPPLKEPHRSSIAGDFSNSVNLQDRPTLGIISEAEKFTDTYEMPFEHQARVSLEQKLVHNSNDITLTESTFRVNYQISTTFEVYETHFNLNRETAARNLQLNYDEIIRDLVNATISRIKSRTINLPEDACIILHPQILGILISIYYSSKFVNTEIGETIWSKNLNLYDDPHRTNGYYSTLFDDEGTLTRGKQLIADGKKLNNLTDLRSSDWQSGGNGFRMEWFQARPRSYQFPVRPAISNLVLTGGTGKGQYFTDRPGTCIVIRDAQGIPSMGSHRGQFILQVHEAEIWRNGIHEGPVKGFSLQGNLDEILTKGHLSADESVAINRLIPGSVYTGWLVIPPSTVVLRS